MFVDRKILFVNKLIDKMVIVLNAIKGTIWFRVHVYYHQIYM